MRTYCVISILDFFRLSFVFIIVIVKRPGYGRDLILYVSTHKHCVHGLVAPHETHVYHILYDHMLYACLSTEIHRKRKHKCSKRHSKRESE